MARQKKGNRAKRIYTVLILFLTAAAGIWGLWQNPGILETITDRAPGIGSDGSMAVHYINVGQGDAQLIVSPDKTAMLIDAGPNSAADSLLAYLDAQNIDELEYAVFTHPHEDHIGGADDVLNKIKVKNVIMPDVSDTTATFSRMLDAIEKNGSAIIISEAGQSFVLGSASFIILAPVSDGYSALNDWSVVLRLDYGKTSFMFTGDAETLSENQMTDKFDASCFYQHIDFKIIVFPTYLNYPRKLTKRYTSKTCLRILKIISIKGLKQKTRHQITHITAHWYIRLSKIPYA
jgi:beta-lactamase superfamily II metal-dependent hydrolase